MSSTPQWIKSQRLARGQCEACGQAPAATTWAGTGEQVCWSCCLSRQAQPQVAVGNENYHELNGDSVMTTKHRHSRFVAGCATCERDLLFFRLTDLRRVTGAQRDEAWALWRAGDVAGLQALARHVGITTTTEGAAR